MKNQPFQSALSVQEGVEQPSQVNPNFRKKPTVDLSVEEYVKGILDGNRVILSRAITLIESYNSKHAEKAQRVIEKILPYSGNSLRIGITGVPGVGKSTFIETLGKYITSQGNKIAVLAIDPSSERTKGSILGDKTRMEELSIDPNAFIRPSPSGHNLGGVARKTRESMILCEAAGFNVIIVETVGVGQSETVVKSMVDFFLLLMLAGAGDELQGIKRGIMEMADAIVINKADGNNIKQASWAKAQYKSALHLFPPTDSGWEVAVNTCSAREHTGIDTVWDTIQDFVIFTQQNGFFLQQRNEQLIAIFKEWINNQLDQYFYAIPEVKTTIEEVIPLIKEKTMTPYQAGSKVLNISRIFAPPKR
ncbi:MAG: methylmalonyl Co-A mutase-associated GTPase MeaB [Bacteroidales bacterium]|jgi:LAO/AO transport system kinase|nr:methylmalonyl Co-A mutase-associated GTPase MeaB [Bacteroidales bacterium]